MTKEQAVESLYLIRNQLDKLPLDFVDPSETLINAYTLLYELWETIDGGN